MSATVFDEATAQARLSNKVKTVKDFTLQVLGRPFVGSKTKRVTARSSVVDIVTVKSDPWDEIIGRYNNDPSWEDFSNWLVEHRSNQQP